jgi:hypothetical protein
MFENSLIRFQTIAVLSKHVLCKNNAPLSLVNYELLFRVVINDDVILQWMLIYRYY